MPKLVYMTTNPGKFEEVSKLFLAHALTLHSPQEFALKLNVDETGQTLEENACLKAESYLNSLPNGTVVIGDDTGVEIDALGGEPGIKVRRWKGYKMSDEEIIEYCIEKMKGIPTGKRGAQFRTVIAISQAGQPTKTFSGILRGHIVTEPIKLRMQGFPFESLFYADEYQLMLGDIHQLSIEEKMAKNILTHRERAVTTALPHLRQALAR